MQLVVEQIPTHPNVGTSPKYLQGHFKALPYFCGQVREHN